MNRKDFFRSLVIAILAALPATLIIDAQAMGVAGLYIVIAVTLLVGQFLLLVWRRGIKLPGGKRETGTVKWFNAKKGFGFIIRDQDEEEIFVHFRGIRDQGNRRRILRDGQKVEFIVTEGRKGPQADDVTVLS